MRSVSPVQLKPPVVLFLVFSPKIANRVGKGNSGKGISKRWGWGVLGPSWVPGRRARGHQPGVEPGLTNPRSVARARAHATRLWAATWCGVHLCLQQDYPGPVPLRVHRCTERCQGRHMDTQ